MAEEEKNNKIQKSKSSPEKSPKSDASDHVDTDSIDVSNMFENMPKEVREQVFMMMSSQHQFGGSPFAGKINEAHIDKLISESAKDSEREFKDKNYQRIFVGIIVILGIAVLVFLTIYLAKDNDALLMRILVPILTFLGGAGLGFGLGKKS
ncbi:MAG TPA: hypothetical protein P5514_14230 [Bacteroidales bacterium]|nr:hypothetical protein [Bacteroidales bacterium]HRX98102.1 hypothetical protein [Bacteroidales bacterium]